MTTKISVLLADTSEDFRQLVSRLVERESDMVLVGAADNGEQALALVREKDPDVLVTDVILPKADGLADMTVRQLTELCEERGIPVPSKPRKADLLAALEGAE